MGEYRETEQMREDLSPYYKNFEKWGLSPIDLEVELDKRHEGISTSGILSAYTDEELEDILAQW